jgi:queuine tRNA-ribosyltransferase
VTTASARATFSLEAQDGPARAGSMTVRGKTLRTPAFLPVGTYGAVKGLAPEMLEQLGAEMLLANAYHLHDRPGADTVAAFGGLHAFMHWDGLLLTDSGGFQVFSMLDIASIDRDGVSFRSPVDGRALRLGPREAVEIQRDLDSDIAMVFDHCPALPTPDDELQRAVDRTTRWAAIAKEAHAEGNTRGQAQFAIVQGGLDDALRQRSAEELTALGFDGYAMGGLSVGEATADLTAAIGRYASLLPEDRVRYVMGIGHPADVMTAIASGFDMFDSVLPTRNGRHGTLFTRDGTIHLRNARFRRATDPIDPDCDCPACPDWSLGVLRHLIVTAEPLGRMLCAAHNLRFLHRLVEGAREAIQQGRFDEYARSRGSFGRT